MGNQPPEVAGKVQKILYCNRCGVRLGAHNAPEGEEADNLFWAWERYCAAACVRHGGPHVASGCGAANIATHFLLANSGCATPFVLTCCCCVSGTLLRGVGVALFVVPRRVL